MDLRPYVENLQQQLLVAADAGGEEARALAQRLLAPLEAAIRLALQDALALAAEEITCELVPGSVELRVRGGALDFAVTRPPAEGADPRADLDRSPPAAAEAGDGDDREMSRINLRMPENLKGRVEQAAAGEGLSVNASLVRAASAALQRGDAPSARPQDRSTRSSKRYTGWAREARRPFRKA